MSNYLAPGSVYAHAKATSGDERDFDADDDVELERHGRGCTCHACVDDAAGFYGDDPCLD